MPRGGYRPGARRPRGAKSKRTVSGVELLSARAHRQAVAVMPLDVLVAAMRDEALPVELRLAAAKFAAPYFHARITTGPVKGSFEMSDLELQTAIEREKEHQLRSDPGPRTFRVVGQR